MTMPTIPSPAAPVPTVSASFTRGLALAVVMMLLAVAAVSAVLVMVFHRPDWTPGFIAAGVVGVVGGAVSIAVLSMAAGRGVDWLITYVMGATVARLGVSGVGMLVAIELLHTPAEPTAYLICGYYAALLIVETTLLARATRGPAGTVGGLNHA